MTILEGIGDEVVYVIGFAVILLIVLLAWYSTSVGEHPIFRASVVVIERRGPNFNNQSNNSHPRIFNVITTANRQTVITTTGSSNSNNENVDLSSSQSTVSEDRPTSNENPDAGGVETTTVLTSPTINNSADSQETQLRNRFQPSIDKSNVEIDKSNVEINKSNVEIVGEEVAESNTQESTGNTPADASNQTETPISNTASTEGNIRIRLVFLNDTQKLVEAKLDDRLGHFKQQHFSEALANQRLVRLIYNGQLLQSDQETLQFYGLSDNCVVHCHISTQRLPAAPQQYSSNSELDLSRLMLPLFGLILGLIWCCRMQYRQYFNAASTFALIGITGLFVVSVFSVCITARNRLQSRG